VQQSYLESKLDLTEQLIQYPSTIYYIRAVEDSVLEYKVLMVIY